MERANLMLMSKYLKQQNPYCNKVVHSFDSFEGLSSFNEKDGVAHESEGSYIGNLTILKDV